MVLLFDIDGTLIDSGGTGRRAMAHAFAEGHGRPDAVSGFSFAGMTDLAILRRGLTEIGVMPTAEAMDALLAAYLLRLDVELSGTDEYRVLPGVAEVVTWARARDGVAVGLGTGNVREGAYAKLRPGDLHGHFAFGGFGCDAEDRTELVRAGAARGATALGVPLAACRVVVIGDTPKDVAAALGIGAACLGVGTGGVAPAELVRLGARWGFATLADDGVRDALLEA
jgi:phosphoglycolate phosphatase-like HAD superfamily hydrolase